MCLSVGDVIILIPGSSNKVLLKFFRGRVSSTLGINQPTVSKVMLPANRVDGSCFKKKEFI